MKHIDQQGDLIKSLQEQIKHIEEARGDQEDDSIPKQREVCTLYMSSETNQPLTSSGHRLNSKR